MFLVGVVLIGGLAETALESCGHGNISSRPVRNRLKHLELEIATLEPMIVRLLLAVIVGKCVGERWPPGTV